MGDRTIEGKQGSLPDLHNTAIAFAARSDRELSRAHLLFRIIGNPFLSKLGNQLTSFAIWLRLPVKGLVKATIFRQFCGGETIEESLGTARIMGTFGVGTILDHSVEGLDDEPELDAACAEIMRTVDFAKAEKNIPFCVFKPSAIARNGLLTKASKEVPLNAAEQTELARVQARMLQICSTAHAIGVPVFVDAEESWAQPIVDAMTHAMMEKFNTERPIVYNTIQLYRHDRLALLKQWVETAHSQGYRYGAKLVRGAYMEKERDRAADKGYPSPIHASKAAVDRDFNEAVRFCVEHLEKVSICAGTHNEDSAMLLATMMHERGIAHDDDRVIFAQLYGMSDHISFNLAHAGYNVAKYVPYGLVRKVLPYLIRRAAENTSVAGQTGRELRLITEERRRRKAERRSN